MKSKIIIVNIKDTIIDHKERGTLNSEDIYRISALWITNNKGEILLARRSFRKSHDPGKWGSAVAGTVEDGENYHTNIIKEAEEELGLKNIKFKKGPKARVQGRHSFFCQWYVLTLNRVSSKFRIQEDEVEEVKWFSKDFLLKELGDRPDQFLPTMKQWIKLFLK